MAMATTSATRLSPPPETSSRSDASDPGPLAGLKQFHAGMQEKHRWYALLAAIIDKNTGFGVSSWLQTFITEQAPADLQPLLASLVQYALVETSEQTAI